MSLVSKSNIKTNVIVFAKKKIHHCDFEWKRFNEHSYFRASLAFYYKDIKKIRLYLETNNQFKDDYEFVVKSNTSEYNATNIKKVILHTFGIYEFGYLEAELSVEVTRNLRVLVSTRQDRSTVLINLIVKNMNTVNQVKKHAMVCSGAYSFKNEHVKMIEWWIEINKVSIICI